MGNLKSFDQNERLKSVCGPRWAIYEGGSGSKFQADACPDDLREKVVGKSDSERLTNLTVRGCSGTVQK